MVNISFIVEGKVEKIFIDNLNNTGWLNSKNIILLINYLLIMQLDSLTFIAKNNLKICNYTKQCYFIS